MKFGLICLFMFAAVAFVLGAKNEFCNLEFAKNGDGRTACMAFFPSFSYKASTNECVEFVYGGCGGNDNRFDTLEECEKKCKV